MTRVLLGSLLAAVVMFMFGFVFWGLSGMPDKVLAGATNEDAARTTLTQMFPSDGFYKVPYSSDWEDEGFRSKIKEGPIATVIIQHEGKDPDDFMPMLMGLAYQFVCILLIAILLSMASGALASYGKRLGFVIIAGIAIGVYSNIGDTIWWNYPRDYPLFTMGYDIVAWTLAGIVLAAIIKPQRGY